VSENVISQQVAVREVHDASLAQGEPRHCGLLGALAAAFGTAGCLTHEAVGSSAVSLRPLSYSRLLHPQNRGIPIYRREHDVRIRTTFQCEAEAADVILRKGQGAPLLERGGAALLLRSVAGGQVPIRVAAFHPDASPQGVRELPAQLGYHETGTALDRVQNSVDFGCGELLFRFQDQVNRIAVEWRCKRLRISGDRPAQAIREIVERLCSASI